MPDEPFYEIRNRNGFFHVFVIFVPVVVESNKAAVIFVNPECGDYRTPEIAANIFDGCQGGAVVGLCIYIEIFFVLPVTAGIDFLKEGPIMASISLSRAVWKALRRKE